MRRQDDEEEAVGQDSFLDVIANIVGILVLLIMVVGARATIVPTAKPSAPVSNGPSAEALNTAIRQATQSRTEVEGVIQQAAKMQIETVQREGERERLQTLVSAVSAEIETRREQMSKDEQKDFDLRRQLSEAQLTLEDLMRREVGIVDSEEEVEQIKSLPTPLAQIVTGDEVHLRLAGGHVAFIPLEQLLDAFQIDAKQNLWKLDNKDHASNVIGPIGNFRLKYFLKKSQLTVPGRGTATMVQLSRWQLMPTEPRIGEPVEQALLETSLLSAHLSRYAPSRTTVTVWVYPDSFQQFRTLKEVLYERGFATAARPLPNGVAIGGSPSGTRSSAQ